MRPRGFITPQLAVALGVAAAMAGLVIWALWERSGRLSCEVARVELTAAYTVLADKVKQQNTAVAQLKLAGVAATARGRAALNEVAIEAAKRQVEIDYWKQKAAAPTPAGATCTDAWREIRAAVSAANSAAQKAAKP